MPTQIIGPFHPLLEEPIQIKIITEKKSLQKEEIVDVDISIGYGHRGIEKLAERKTFQKAVILVGRVCGICSNIHPLCFVQAVEDIAKVEAPDRARYIRTVIAELERIKSHLLAEGLLAHKIGLSDLFISIFAERAKIMDVFETVTGNRVHPSMQTIGGVRRDINNKQAGMIVEALDNLDPAVKKIRKAIEDPNVTKRTEGRGLLIEKEARKLDVVGPIARASGIPFDIRTLDPYAAYSEIDFDVVTRTEGDVKARSMVRIDEIFESSKIIRRALDAMPGGPVSVPIMEIPKGEAIGRGEAPRGENMHYVKSNESLYPERVKIRSPTFANLPALKSILIGESMADPTIIPLVIASLDSCIACTDR